MEKAEKKCVTCFEIKKISEFEKNKTSHRAKCKECRRKEARDNYWKKPEEKKAYSKTYRDNHKEYYNKYNKEYPKLNPEKEKARRAKHYNENKEYYAERHRERKNDPKFIEYSKDYSSNYRKNNKESVTEKKKLYMREQALLNTDYVKRCRLRSLIKSSLKRHGTKKSERSEELLGCTASFAIEQLQSMGYNKEIHDMDHIVPLCNFNIDSEIHRKVAFNYLNMQPLLISTNRSKQGKLENNWEEKITEICVKLSFDPKPIIDYIENKTKVVA